MRNILNYLVLLFCLIITSGNSLAQIQNTVAKTNKKEAEIRRLENLEREAVLKRDTKVLFEQLWSPEMVVNAPSNRVGTFEITKKRMLEGKIDYASFERNIEKITFNNNLAIVMGEEKVKPQSLADNTGKIVIRRFTNIWKYSNKRWKMIARQATIISVE